MNKIKDEQEKMIELSNLTNTCTKKRTKRVGRGPSSGCGKTCSRGHKGQGARSGYRRRYGNEGGQMRLYKKLPCRGFTRGRFIKPTFALNLDQIDKMFQDGDVVNFQTLREKGYAPRLLPGGLRILSRGELTKKLTIEANYFSKETIRKLDEAKINYKILEA